MSNTIDQFLLQSTNLSRVIGLFPGILIRGDSMRRETALGIIKKHSVRMVFGGVAYGLIELLWRGRTHWTMVLTGGVCYTLLSGIYRRCGQMRLFRKCLLGGAVITACEFVCGMVVNVRLGLRVWDYSDRKFNVKGQICPLFSLLWVLLCIPISFMPHSGNSCAEGTIHYAVNSCRRAAIHSCADA